MRRLAGLSALTALVMAAPAVVGVGTGSLNPLAGSSVAGAATATISGPGVTAHEIKIGQIATVSGPVPGLFKDAADSMDAFAAYVNSKGGIDGKKLVVVHKDDAYDCVTYTNALKSLSTQVFAMVGTFSVEDGCGASVLKSDPHLPNLEAYVLTPTLLSYKNTFASEVQPPGFFTTGYQWVKNKYPNDIASTAAIYPSTAAFEFNEQSDTAKTIGYHYVYTRGLGNTESNFTSDILRMKSENVKIVDLTADPVNIMATFVAEAAQQGYHPAAIIDPAAYDDNFFKLLGAAPASATANVIAPIQWAMYLGEDRASTPALNTYLTWLGKKYPGETSTVFGISAWSAGIQFLDALKAAGSNVTQQSLINATSHLGVFTADGLTPGSDPGKRIGPHCVIIAGISNGKYVRLDPKSHGFECDGKYVNIPISKLS